MNLREFVTNKLFLGTSTIRDTGVDWITPTTSAPFTATDLLKNSTANRCFNMIVDSTAGVPYEVKPDTKSRSSFSKMQPAMLTELINKLPNKWQDANYFWRKITEDLMLQGNAFILVEKNELFS